MTDVVSAAKDNLKSRQWGKNFLFLKDAKKQSLNTKVFCTCLGLVSCILFTVQLLLGENATEQASPNPITLPSTLKQGETIEVALQTSTQSDKSTKTRTTTITLSGPQLIERPRDLKNIPPGALVNARLSSGASNGLVRAELTEDLRVNGTTLIESGSVLVGQGASSEHRLRVRFSQVVFRDGRFGKINAHACDAKDKTVGLKGSTVGTKALNVVGSIGLGFVGGLAEGLQEKTGQQGTTIAKPTLKNGLLNATSRTALEQSRSLMSGLKNSKPTIEVPPNTPICVLFGGSQ